MEAINVTARKASLTCVSMLLDFTQDNNTKKFLFEYASIYFPMFSNF